MPQRKSLTSKLMQHAHRVTALVLSTLWPGRSLVDVDRWMSDLPAPKRRMCIIAVVGGLFALALLAASFGPVGLAVYFIAIVLLVR